MTEQPCRDLAALCAADEAAFLHAVAHVGAGRVGEVTRTGRGGNPTVTAVVADTPRRTVRLSATTATCPCPAGKRRGGLCEHALAVAVTDLVAVSGISVTDLVATWFSGEPMPAGRSRHHDSDEFWDDSDEDDDWDDDEDPWEDDEDEDGGSGAEPGDVPRTGLGGRGPAERRAVLRFVDGLSDAQVRGLLLALAGDLPDVADALVDLGRPSTAPE